jgi:hypothetical protein
MRAILIAVAVVLAGCGSSSAPAPEKAETKAAASAPPPVSDNTALLLTENRTGASVVQDHVLGNKALPGGTVGEYASGKDKYELFIVETPGAQDAAILLLDWKGTLANPDFDAGFGGYFGTDGGKPVFGFTKGKYLVGVAGLDRKAADPIARLLAARIH